MKRLILVAVLILGLSFPAMAKKNTRGLEWEDSNTLTDLTHFNVYICDQAIPDTPVDEFNGADGPVTCPGNMVTVQVPYAPGTTQADVEYTVTVAKGSLFYRVDVERANGIRSLLSNMVEIEYDFVAPKTVTVRVKIK